MARPLEKFVLGHKECWVNMGIESFEKEIKQISSGKVLGIIRGATQEISQRSILSGKYIFEVQKYFLQCRRSI